MDWTIVVSGAITGAVGIAGVAGTIIAARIAGNSARESVRLNIAAEAARARVADKRRIYARAISALMAVTTDDYNKAAIMTAVEALSEVQLIAPRTFSGHSGAVLTGLLTSSNRSDIASMQKALAALFEELRADLDKEEQRAN